jgi:hypothetical protein
MGKNLTPSFPYVAKYKFGVDDRVATGRFTGTVVGLRAGRSKKGRPTKGYDVVLDIHRGPRLTEFGKTVVDQVSWYAEGALSLLEE